MTRPPALWRNLIRLALVLALAWGLHLLFAWARAEAVLADAGGAGLPVWILCAMLAIYALMIAIPFVPGIEVGLALMMVAGAWVSPAVYGATIAGLLLAYGVGTLVPYATLRRICADLRLARAADVLNRIEPLDRAARLALLQDSLPRWVRPFAGRYRYLMLAVLINLPGSMLVGGGGGLLMFAGLSRLFAPLPTLLTVLLAVAPVPLAVSVLGWKMG